MEKNSLFKEQKTTQTCTFFKFRALKTDVNDISLDLKSHWLHDAP